MSLISEILIFDPINRFIWICVIIEFFLFSTYNIIRAFQQNDISKEKKKLLIGLGFFLIGVAFLRLSFFFSDYNISGYYVGHSYYGTYGNYKSDYTFLNQLGYVVFFIGISVFISEIEEIIRLSRIRILGLINISFIILCLIIFPFKVQKLIFIYVAAIDIFLIFLLLLWIVNQSEQNLEPISFLLGIGSILVILGTFLDSRYIKELEYISPTLPAIIIMFGLFIIMFPSFFDSEVISQTTLLWWFILIIINIFMFIFTFLFLFNIPMPSIFYYIILFSSLVYLSTIAYSIFRIKVYLNSINLNAKNGTLNNKRSLSFMSKIRQLRINENKNRNRIELVEDNVISTVNYLVNRRKYSLKVIHTIMTLQSKDDKIYVSWKDVKNLVLREDNKPIPNPTLNETLNFLIDEEYILKITRGKYQITKKGEKLIQLIKNVKDKNNLNNFFYFIK